MTADRINLAQLNSLEFNCASGFAMLNIQDATVDLVFSLAGSAVPQDHGYALYGAVSRAVPGVHAATGLGIFPIQGVADGRKLLHLTSHSVLRLRLFASQIPELLPLAGKALELDGHRVRVGVPHVAALVPASLLASPLVTIKLANATSGEGFVPPDAFLAAATKKLQERGIQGTPHIQRIGDGPRAGQARRRVIRIKGQTHVGYAMVVDGLTAEESIDLQESGLGGRRLMGCGLFLPPHNK